MGGAPARFLALALAACASGRLPAQPAGERIGGLARRLLEADLAVGLVVGTLEAGRTTFHGFGRISREDPRPPDERTVYEIGSITKVFTGVLLAAAATRGEVALDDPLEEHLPEGVGAPRRGGEPVRLVHLATHTSGLPRLPPGFRPSRPGNPYADYSRPRLLEDLAGADLASVPGRTYAYSNLGAGLLGDLLCLKAGTDYDTLLERRVAGPLGLADTRCRPGSSARWRLAPGYDADGRPRNGWDFDALAGAGAVRSTAADLLAFARANLDPSRTPLGTILDLAQQVRHAGGPRVALGWHVAGPGRILWHNGGTGGYRSFLAIDRARGVAVALLANTTSRKLDELGWAAIALLAGREPPPVRVRRTVEVPRETLEACVGRYRLGPRAVLAVTLEDGSLWGRVTGQPKHRLHPASAARFFLRAVAAEVTFERDDEGRVAALVLHQGGRSRRAPREE